MSGLFRSLAWSAVALAFALVMLGAYVRLADAGLGCPDWPGCYGHLTVPRTDAHLHAANAAYPDRPVELHKAWKEMAHRYVAGTLGMMILALAVLAWRNRRSTQQPVWLPIVMVGLVIFQALLGMWTVTLKVMPLVVTAHLAFGFATLALLFLLALRTSAEPAPQVPRGMRAVAAAALLVVAAQILLGAWTSSNYAALACPDFPTCQTRWWPDTDFAGAFRLSHGLGVDYQYGVLDNAPRMTIHLTHRLGAVVTLLVMLAVSGYLVSAGLRVLGGALFGAVALQAGLGVSVVLLHLPLPLAVAHNGGAALLLLVLVAINHCAWRARRTT